MGMTDEELTGLCVAVSTWDQAEIDGLLGKPAILYAQAQEANVRKLASEMWTVFPLGPRWWKIRAALVACRKKASAIKARAEQIQRGRDSGEIVVVNGQLAYARDYR